MVSPGKPGDNDGMNADTRMTNTTPIEPEAESDVGEPRTDMHESLIRDSAAEPDPARRLYAVRRSALIEMGLFFGVALLIDFVFLDGTRFWSVAPHPFWIAVVLMSVQYGTNEGVLCAIVSTILLLAGNLPDQGVEEDLYAYLLSISLTPILWLVTGVLVGELRLRQINKETGLAEALADARERESIITTRYKDLQAVKERLETRVAGQLKTVFSTYQAAKELENLSGPQVLLGVSKLVDSVLGPQKFSIFLLQDDVLQAGFGKGWTIDDPYLRDFRPNSPLFQQVIGAQKFIWVVDPVGQRVLDGQGIMAGPLVYPETGEVIGMIKIEQMDFLDVNVSALENFKILCEWVATSYANARNYEMAKNETAFDPTINMLTSTFFERQRSFVLALARRTDIPVAMLLLDLGGERRPTAEEKQQCARVLSEQAGVALRATDLVFDHNIDGYDYAIILPNTTAQDGTVAAQKLADNLTRSLTSVADDLAPRIAVQSLYEPDTKELPKAPAKPRKAASAGTRRRKNEADD